MSTPVFNKKVRKKKSSLKVSASNLEGVNNDSFEMEEIKPVPLKKEVIQTVKKIDEHKPKPQKRTKRHKTGPALSTSDPSASKGDHQNDRSKVQQLPPDYDKIVGIVIHRADQLRISPHPGYLAVRIHMMDDKRRGYAVRQDADCVIPPAVTTPIEHVQGHIYLPVWEEMLLINERFSVVAHGSSVIFFFEILTLSTPDIPLNALRCSITSKSVDTIAWAFLRPVGANGHQNVGPRKQRLQLYEPVPDYNPLVSITGQRKIALQNNQKPIIDRSNDAEFRHDWQAVGEHLYAWWATGTRVQYPSTLYVTVKKIDLEQLIKMNGSTDPFKLFCEPSLNLVTLTENEKSYSTHRDTLHLRNTNDAYSSLGRPGWPREADQPCRIPNELIGGGINRFSFASEVSLMSSTAGWNRAHQMDGAQSVRFSPNGKWLAVGCGGPNVINQRNGETTASQDCAVFLYKHPLTSSSTQPQLHLAGHTKTVYSVDWSPKPVCLQQKEYSSQPNPDGSRCSAWLLASASADGTVRVWWLTLDQLINTPLTQTSRDLPCDSTGEVHNQRILRITAAESDHQSPRHVTKTLALTRKTNHKGVLCTVLGHPSFVYCARFCPVSLDPAGSMQSSHSCRRQLLATACYDQIVRVWNIGRKRAELLQELTGHHQSYINTVAFNVSGYKLHSGDAKGNLVVWTYDGNSNNPGWKFHQRISNRELEDCIINHLEVHPIQNLLLVHTRDSCPKMIDLRSGFTSARFHGMLNHQQLLRSCITPCGSFVISGSEDCNVYVWNAITGDPVACYRQLQFTQPVTSISFHPTENVIAFASLDRESPLLLYAYNPQVHNLEISLNRLHYDISSEGQKYSLEKRNLDQIRAQKERRKTARVRVALAKLDSVVKNEKPLKVENTKLDELEWRPKFTAIDEVPTHLIGMHRGHPDGEAVAHDFDTRQPDSGQTLANEGHSQIAFVLYDYQAQRSDELTVERGSRVRLLHKDTPKWWMVKSLESEKEGYVPANYLSNDQDFTHKDDEKNHFRTDPGKQAIQLAADDNCLGPRTRAGMARAAADRITELVRLHECDQKQVMNCTIQTTVENTPTSTSQTPPLSREIKTSSESQPEPYLNKTVARKSRSLPEGDDALFLEKCQTTKTDTESKVNKPSRPLPKLDS